MSRDTSNTWYQASGADVPRMPAIGDKCELAALRFILLSLAVRWLVMRTATGCYILLQACRELGLVHANFPHYTTVVGSTITGAGDTASESIDSTQPRPAPLPSPSLVENAPRLEECLLCHFSGPTFNTNRSPQPVMAGEPHVIHLLPNAKSYACHVPAFVYTTVMSPFKRLSKKSHRCKSV